MPIDPKILETLKPGELLPVHEVPGWGTEGFDEETLRNIMRESIKNVSISPIDLLKQFIFEQDYSHPFMLSLFVLYGVMLLGILKFRRKAMMQMVFFFASFLVIQSTSIINDFLRNSVGETMYDANPFDEDMLFTNVFITLPAGVFIAVIFCNMIMQSVLGYCGRRNGHKHGPQCNHEKKAKTS